MPVKSLALLSITYVQKIAYTNLNIDNNPSGGTLISFVKFKKQTNKQTRLLEYRIIQ